MVIAAGDAGGLHPSDESLISPAGAPLLERNDEWLVGRGYLSLESMASVLAAEHAHATTLEVTTLTAG